MTVEYSAVAAAEAYYDVFIVTDDEFAEGV